jgi:hypothetical protein
MPVGFSDIKSRKIVISEGGGGPLRAFGNILLPDPPCDQGGLRSRWRIGEPQRNCFSVCHALGVKALKLEGHPVEKGEFSLLRNFGGPSRDAYLFDFGNRF